MKVAIIGSRSVTMRCYPKLCAAVPIGASEIISGGASGADDLAQKYAEEMELPLKVYLPIYEKYGKRAPLVRNMEIIHSADYVIALWDGISRGTSHLINDCIKEYIPIKVIYCGNEENSIWG